MNSAIILAGGSGTRTNLKTPKQFVNVNPKNCIIDYSIRTFKSASKITAQPGFRTPLHLLPQLLII